MSLPLLPSFTAPISFERMIRERFLIPNEQILQKYFPSIGTTSYPVFVYIKLDSPEPPNFFTSSSSSSNDKDLLHLQNHPYSNTRESLGAHALNTFDPKSKVARNFVQDDAYLRAAAFFLPPICSGFLRMYCSVVVQFNPVDEGGLFLFGVSICEAVTRHNTQRGITTRTFVRRGDRRWTAKNPLPTSKSELTEISKRMRRQNDLQKNKKRRVDEGDANQDQNNHNSNHRKIQDRKVRNEMIVTASKTIFEQGGSSLQNFRYGGFGGSKFNIIHLSPRLLLSHFRIKSQLKTFISDEGIFFFQNVLDRTMSILDAFSSGQNTNSSDNVDDDEDGNNPKTKISFHLEISCAQMFSHVWDRVPSVKVVAKKLMMTRLKQIQKSQRQNSIVDSNQNTAVLQDHGHELKENSITGIIQLMGACCHLASRLNFRGAAIVTKNKIVETEKTCRNTTTTTSDNDEVEENVRRDNRDDSFSTKPVSIQVLTRSYLNVLLREFSRRVCRTLVEPEHPTNNPCFEPTTIPKTEDAEVWLYGSSENLNHLLDNFQKWISCSTRGGENASLANNLAGTTTTTTTQAKPATSGGGGIKSFLLIQGVKLSIIPWLIRVEQGNNHRNARLQQTFAVFWTWMMVFAIPHWIKKSFHVTYSPRQSSLLLFYLLEDWHKWMKDALKPSQHELAEALTLFGQDNRSGAKSEKATSSLVVKGFGPTPLNAASRRSLKNRTAKSPLAGSALFYSSVRWLPGGSNNNKLRPISLIRCGSAKALGRIAIQKPILFLLQQQQRLFANNNNNNNKKPFATSSASASSASVTMLMMNNKDKSIQFLDRSPNRTVLRKALFCLYSGLRERRLTVSEPGISRGTPAEDYAELLPFVRKLIVSSAGKNFIKIHFVKADASKCFDLLSQNTVREMITHLVPHDRYQMLDFDAIVKLTARPNSKIQHVAVVSTTSNTASSTSSSSIQQIAKQASVGGVYLYRTRRWTKTLSAQEFRDGIVPCIPKGWIVEGRPFASETLSGEWVRQVLNEHTQNHLRVIQGRLYHQAVGIPQGSSVSSVICDACLSSVDDDISEILENHLTRHDPATRQDAEIASEGCDARINHRGQEHFNLTLRRMDDLLILSTSEETVEECKQRIIRGWPDIGFICNEEKLIVSSTTTRSEENDCPTMNQFRETVPWCGLLLHCFHPSSATSSSSSSLAIRRCLRFPIEGSIDWSRVEVETLARACMINPQQESSLMIGVFRAIKSIQMRFSPCCICATMNSKKRVAQNLLEVFICIASAFCEMLLLTLNSTRPHPRVFFRARVAAESCMRTHCMSHLAGIVQKNNSCVYNDGLIFHLCEITSLMAFSRVIMMYQNNKWPVWFKLRGAAYIACAAFVETLKKRQEYYGMKMRKLNEVNNNNHENQEDFDDVFDETVFDELKKNIQKSKIVRGKNRVPFTVVSAK